MQYVSANVVFQCQHIMAQCGRADSWVHPEIACGRHDFDTNLAKQRLLLL
jgi:hypothetical protein